LKLTYDERLYHYAFDFNLRRYSKVFWVSENYLYHAYAWYKLFNLSKQYNRNLTAGGA